MIITDEAFRQTFLRTFYFALCNIVVKSAIGNYYIITTYGKCYQAILCVYTDVYTLTEFVEP